MNKFQITNPEVFGEVNESLPVLYKVYFKDHYFLHKSKEFKNGVDRLLDDVFRGIRGKKSCPESYNNIVSYCDKYPALYKVSLEIVLNAPSDKILKKEDALWKQMKSDPLSLNDVKVPPYKPEWMLKQSLQARCDSCIKEGSVSNKKMKFKFCPKCGRLNR